MAHDPAGPVTCKDARPPIVPRIWHVVNQKAPPTPAPSIIHVIEIIIIITIIIIIIIIHSLLPKLMKHAAAPLRALPF